jgi:ABC-type sulfate/molybdate transport systems ATPase subunit
VNALARDDPAMLDADLQLQLSRLNLDVAFTVAPGEVLALLGPNGSGKSTILRALTGLLPLAGGRVVLDDTVLEDPARGKRVASEKRSIGLMFQEYLLFPHMSALENVAFGLRATGTDKNAANILVTHDLLDAVALGDRMIVIDHGGVVQTGTPAEVTARPQTRYVADLTGVNLLSGTANGKVVALDGGGRLTGADPAAGPVLAVISPAAVSVSRQRPGGPEQNVWPGQVNGVDLMGDRVRVRIDGKPAITAEVLPSKVDELKLDDGGQVWATVSPSALTLYPPTQKEK